MADPFSTPSLTGANVRSSNTSFSNRYSGPNHSRNSSNNATLAMQPPTGLPKGFDPNKYVEELSIKPATTIEGLLQAQKLVQSDSDETNGQLKRQVYKNYQLFIDTSKEINYMKNEMSQLNSLINEELKLIESKMSVSICGSRAGLSVTEKKEALEKFKEERERKMLQASKSMIINGPLPATKEFKSIIGTIEGGASILGNRVHSLVYHDGEVIELDDKEDYKELHIVYLVVLNDALIISTVIPEKQRKAGGCKYRYQNIIDLETIAIVNVKDRRYVKFERAFKILMSATTKMFLTSSPASKKSWCEAFDIAKRYCQQSRNPRRDTMIFSQGNTVGSGSGGSSFELMKSKSDLDPMSSGKSPYAGKALNPFEEDELVSGGGQDEPEQFTEPWLLDLPDDLDVCIAQRNFEDAVKLVNSAQEHFNSPKWCDNQMQIDLKLKIDNKISELVDALAAELNVAPDRSVQTGPRASRRAVALLLRLGKSSLAIRLFLDQRTKILKYYLNQEKTKDVGGSSSFMKTVTQIVFTHIVDATKEFCRAFQIDLQIMTNNALDALPESGEGTSSSSNFRRNSMATGVEVVVPITSTLRHAALACLTAWNYEQFKSYLSLFPKHVFISQMSSQMAADCVGNAIHQCIKIRQTLGFDLLFVLSSTLKNDIGKIICDITNKMLEAIKHRSGDDTQAIQRFENDAKLSKFVSDLKELELVIDDELIESDGGEGFTVLLTTNTVKFARSYLSTEKDLLKLANSPVTVRSINESLVLLFRTQLRHLDMLSTSSRHDHQLNRRNLAFLLDRLIPVAVKKYCETLNLRSFEELQALAREHRKPKGDNNNNSQRKQYTHSQRL